LISKEPLGPVVRQGDDQWADIARWSLNALIGAEELGLTQKNVKSFLKSENPEIRRFLGVESSFGESLGLQNDWALNIVSQVGNYGESFERNLGKETRLGIERGLNAQWHEGGLMYAPPVR
jgi:general L-amino acid transport system substrate-binding protein